MGPQLDRTEPAIRAVAWIESCWTMISALARGQLFAELPAKASAVIGIGGGKARDVANPWHSCGHLPYFA